MIDEQTVGQLPNLENVSDRDVISGLSGVLDGTKTFDVSVQMTALQTLEGILSRSKDAETIKRAYGTLHSAIGASDESKNIPPEVGRKAIEIVGESGKNQPDIQLKTVAIDAIFSALKGKTKSTWERKFVEKDGNTENISRHDLAIEAVMKIASPITVTNEAELKVVDGAKRNLGTFVGFCKSNADMTPLQSTIAKAVGGMAKLGDLQGVAKFATLNTKANQPVK